jgi:hypothetical protein
MEDMATTNGVGACQYHRVGVLLVLSQTNCHGQVQGGTLGPVRRPRLDHVSTHPREMLWPHHVTCSSSRSGSDWC